MDNATFHVNNWRCLQEAIENYFGYIFSNDISGSNVKIFILFVSILGF